MIGKMGRIGRMGMGGNGGGGESLDPATLAYIGRVTGAGSTIVDISSINADIVMLKSLSTWDSVIAYHTCLGGITLDGNKITKLWSVKGTHDLTQANGANQPTLNGDIGGKTAMVFSGSQYIGGGDAQNNANGHMLIIYKKTNTTREAMCSGYIQPASVQNSANVALTGLVTGANGCADPSTGSGIRMVSIRRAGTNTYAFRRNGQNVSSASSGDWRAATKLYIGANDNGGIITLPLNGEIAMVLALNANIADATLSLMENHFNSKYQVY